MSLVNRVPIISFFMLYLIISCLPSSLSIRNKRCASISRESKNDVLTHLHGIERGLRILKEEGLYGIKEFEHIHLIIHHFLSSKYKYVQGRLKKLVRSLRWYSGTNRNTTGYISEAVIDFSRHALVHAKQAQPMIQLLAKCDKNLKNRIRGKQKDTGKCFADGSQCQYNACAQGKKLPVCAIGFATGVTGGAAGSYYIVTHSDDNNSDNPTPGTLRHAVEFSDRNRGGAWIVFRKSMVITLTDKLWIPSDTTIDGRNVNVTIIHKGLVLARVRNVILHNIEVLSTGNSDTVHVFDGTKLVWIDHLTSRDAYLGLVTVLQGSTDITVSNCFLSNHNFNMLLGASDEDTMDQALRVTVYRNWFESSSQRMPHCRWGYCHVVNNYYRNWHYYTIGGRVHARILSEQNAFEPGAKLEVTPWHEHIADLTPTIQSSQDLLLKGATFHQFLPYGSLVSSEKQFPRYSIPIRPTFSLISLVTNCSGVLSGHKLRNCMTTT